jgi:adenylate cyclase
MGQLIERPAATRPTSATIDGISEWLIGPARQLATSGDVFDEFCWRMLATGLPLLRLTLHGKTLHPQFLGSTFMWWRTTGQTTQTLIAHQVGDLIRHQDNPVQRVWSGETLRRRVDVPDHELDFTILHELKAAEATDYLALPVAGANRINYMVSFLTDRPTGFIAQEVTSMTWISQRLASVIDIYYQQAIAQNVLAAYLGFKTGPRVLEGQIRRGTGEEITAVLWSSDLRGFTERSDRLPGQRVITILNALFDAQAAAIHDHGGEILKFIGDGLLAIFPINDAASRREAARGALEAAWQTVKAVEHLAYDGSFVDEPPLQVVVALHVGTVIYGNIGAAERLDFTVIGPAVNLVSRVEAVAKALNMPIVVTDDFASAYGRQLLSLGCHQLRGLTTPHELFTPVGP